jgi:hypothetical protein
METVKKVKPVYIYLVGGVLSGVGYLFKEFPIIHYSFLFLGLCFVIFAIVKYFRDKI